MDVVELPKFLRTVSELCDDSDRWMYFLRHGREFDTATLPAALAAVPEIQQATGTLTMVSLNPIERERYEAQLKFNRDQQALLQDALDRGTRLGLDEGHRLGLNEGRAQEVRALIERIGDKRLGAPPATVIAALRSETNLDRLHELADRILDCANWELLLTNSVDE